MGTRLAGEYSPGAGDDDDDDNGSVVASERRIEMEIRHLEHYWKRERERERE
jgi:hypothetical protein